MNLNNGQVAVSVCIFSYNFENYIVQAVKSVFEQQVDFPMEILVADDCSTDNTRKLLEELKLLYPSLKLLLNQQNMGGTRNWVNAFRQCKGKYVALLDGDDYFCHHLKLQKQYEAMEKNPYATICLHDVLEHYEDEPSRDTMVRFEKERYTIEDILEQGWFIRTSSTFMRNDYLVSNPPDWVYNYPYRYDTILQVFHTQKGDVINIKECLSVYRKYAAGYSNNFRKNIVKNILTAIELHQMLDKYTARRYHNAARRYVCREYTYLMVVLLKQFKFTHLPLLFRSMMNIHFPTLRKIVADKYLKSKAA